MHYVATLRDMMHDVSMDCQAYNTLRYIMSAHTTTMTTEPVNKRRKAKSGCSAIELFSALHTPQQFRDKSLTWHEVVVVSFKSVAWFCFAENTKIWALLDGGNPSAWGNRTLVRSFHPGRMLTSRILSSVVPSSSRGPILRCFTEPVSKFFQGCLEWPDDL